MTVVCIVIIVMKCFSSVINRLTSKFSFHRIFMNMYPSPSLCIINVMLAN